MGLQVPGGGAGAAQEGERKTTEGGRIVKKTLPSPPPPQLIRGPWTEYLLNLVLVMIIRQLQVSQIRDHFQGPPVFFTCP